MSENAISSPLKRNITLTVIAGAAATITFNLTNPFFSLFVLRLGGTDYHVGWLSALPGLAAVLALIPGGAFVDRFTYKKKITCALIGASRFFYLCLALVPFLNAWQATVFVILVGMMRFPSSVSEIAWQSFFADYVPDDQRGFAYAHRQRIATIVGMIVTFTAGQILSHFPKSDMGRIRFYQVFFIIAFVVGCFEVYNHYRIKEPKYENEGESESLGKKTLKERFKLLVNSFDDTPQAKRFLIFATCSIIFHFGWQMGWPLFSLYQIKTLNATEGWIAIITVISNITSALSYNYWNRFAERFGNDKTLVITATGMAMTPIIYALSPTLVILAAVNSIVGISTAGFLLTLMNNTLREAPKFQRTLYIACYNTIINVSIIFAPNIGVFISTNFGIRRALCAAAFFRFLGAVAFFIRYRYHAREEKESLAA